jgi:hypothetical protein
VAPPPADLKRRRWWRSVRWSAMLHASLMALLLAQWLWLPPLGVPPAVSRQGVEVHVSLDDWQPEAPVDTPSWIVGEVNEPQYAAVDLNDPRWDYLLSEPQRAMEAANDDASVDRAAGELLSEQLLRAIEDASEDSADENLAELATMSDRLTAVSSRQGVDEVAGTLGRLTGASERATEPNPLAAGEFDHATAQPQDCRKEDSPDGTLRYVVVLIDAQGRTQEAEIDAATGEQLYQTMQLIKANPLLERLYRKVVMGMLDKLLQPPAP